MPFWDLHKESGVSEAAEEGVFFSLWGGGINIHARIEGKSEKEVSKAFPTGPTMGWRRILCRFQVI